MSIIELIKDYLQGRQVLATNGNGKPADEEAKIATAVVLLEIACDNGNIPEKESSLIYSILKRELALKEYEAEELINYASKVANGSEFDRCIKTINECYSDDQKRYILTLLWKIAFADNVVKDFELVITDHVRTQLGLSLEDSEQSKKEAQRIAV